MRETRSTGVARLLPCGILTLPFMYMTDSDVFRLRLRGRRETSGLPGHKLYALSTLRPHAMKS